MKNAIIITGASKGLGKALALCYSDWDCYLFARSEINIPTTYAKQIDLSKLDLIQDEFHNVFSEIKRKKYDTITLINNAALIEPIGYSGNQDTRTLINSLNVGFTSVLVITNLFIDYFQDLDIKKRIMTISSGAATNPYPGWSHYCAAKAGINMFSEAVSKEQELQKHPVEMCTFRPGVIDTSMQDAIREQSKENFPLVERFIQLRNDSLLRKPEDVAKVIKTILSDNDSLLTSYNINDFD